MSDDLVAQLAESIGQSGLLQPILVQQVDAEGGGEDRFSLVSGHHRFLACKDILGWTEIDAAIVDADDLRTEFVAIDENLIRNELGAADATRHHRRRKQIYEQLHPETKANVAGGRARQGSVAEVPSYAADAAAATGKSERNVRRLLERANNLAADELNLVAATCLDNGADIRRLNELSPEQRMPLSTARETALG